LTDHSTIRSSDATGASFSQAGRGYAGLVTLFASEPERLENVYVFRRDEVRIGRDGDNDIELSHETVSRSHAELVYTDEGWIARDLKSRNGTLVDGRRVRAAALKQGSILRIGDLLFKFVEREAELHAAYLPDGRMRGAATRIGPNDSRLIGNLEMDRVALNLSKVAKSKLSVLVLGESGTGKEIAAQEVHRLSARKGRFSAINCAAIPGNLLESELFGYRKGAFSGATQNKAGLFQVADGGTLLLDEIGDMPPESQAKLLRVLQSKQVTPVGALDPISIDVRVVAATHQNLDALQRTGGFRADLFARLGEFVLKLPPLRDRKEDIGPLCLFFLRNAGAERIKVSVGFMAALLHYDWPYNVRELESCIKRCLALNEGTVLRRRHLPETILEACRDYGSPADGEVRISTRPRASEPPPDGPSEQELRALLALHKGNITAIAREFGKARMQVHRWLTRYGIDPIEYRDETGTEE
jgi:DNA-binding NtrC family response regulator